MTLKFECACDVSSKVYRIKNQICSNFETYSVLIVLISLSGEYKLKLYVQKKKEEEKKDEKQWRKFQREFGIYIYVGLP